ncbi:HAD family hydrolase [Thalassolituus marinus]|uniref:Capsular biosynthesis protein n=1 Tax=Thalassolituus marinus TaxID=671053 RepID=A0ABS7ZRT3_9GAMM|nr:capsular biosynthesis protein [Thalassolituus marinus]MCA6063121.1 capsular biosynthesis protein [Thalassolituus marinus]
MKRLVFDLDNTLTIEGSGDYNNVLPRLDMIDKLREYKNLGFDIIISTSRNMRTYNSSVGKITANTLPVIFEWLAKHNVPYDEIHVGKPWCGHEGFYIDDKSIRPSEFRSMNYEEIIRLLANEK